jgi:NADH-quinone oxidoreductase subunit G
MPDQVVWVPSFSPGSHVRRSLARSAGAVVRVSVDARTSANGRDRAHILVTAQGTPAHADAAGGLIAEGRS